MMNKLIQSLMFSTLLLSGAVFATEAQLSRTLTPEVSVTGQMTTDKFSALLQQGFKSVIVNRPDDEVGNLSPVHQLKTLADAKNIALVYQPVISGQISQQDVSEFAAHYNRLAKPILMVCKSGSRSSALFNQAKIQGLLNE